MSDYPSDDAPEYLPLSKWDNFEPRLKSLMMGLRQVLIMSLGLVEDFLDHPRSIVPLRKRGQWNDDNF